MAPPKKYLTTKEFSSISGVPVSSLRRLLREGRLEATKSSGKWMIPESQLQSEDIQKTEKSAESDPVKKTYAVEEFAEMTFLTPFGVEQDIPRGACVWMQKVWKSRMLKDWSGNVPGAPNSSTL